jgi:hypothetical protein
VASARCIRSIREFAIDYREEWNLLRRKAEPDFDEERQQILRLLVSDDEFDFHRQCGTDP